MNPTRIPARRLAFAWLLAVVTVTIATQQRTATQATAVDIPAALAAAVAADGTAPVIVGVRAGFVPEGYLADQAAVAEQLDSIADKLGRQFPAVGQMLREAEADICAFAAFPVDHWRRIWSTNPLERLIKEVKRRSDVVGIFPDETSILRLVGAVLIEAHDEWAIAERRYLSEGSMAAILAAGETTDLTTTPPALLAS